ncbi:gastrula zinc finger protein XlCGF8.2DB-like [Heterodontus francisci]|uniref:gastrula zinc finger protein XlCGF8.2DB-like n=1 Tax=Heterodontus francisci TaxID=7792 RepID=UPI00355B9E03
MTGSLFPVRVPQCRYQDPCFLWYIINDLDLNAGGIIQKFADGTKSGREVDSEEESCRLLEDINGLVSKVPVWVNPEACKKCVPAVLFYVQSSWKHNDTCTVEKPWKCGDCGKGFNSPSSWKLINTGERPFTCSVCGKGFTFSSSLYTHQCIHTGEWPFTSSVCGKRFTYSYRLNRHQRIKTGEKPFTCSVCGKGFIQSSQLNEHQFVHTEERLFRCSDCEKRFKNTKDLLRH